MDVTATVDGQPLQTISGLPDKTDPALLLQKPDGSWAGIDIPAGRNFRIEGKVSAPTITTTSVPAGKVGVAYPSTALTATGGLAPLRWAAVGLPPGLSLSDGGVLSGTPTAFGTSTATFNVTAADGQTSTVRITVAVTPPDAPTSGMRPVPAGYKQVRSFTPAQLAVAVHVRTGHQGGTESYSLTKNVFLDTAIGALRLRSLVEETNGYQYSSAYCDIGSTVASDRLPLFCRVRILVRYPFDFGKWCSAWLDYLGAASKFEIDFGELFTDMAPGCNNVQVHSPDTAKAFTGGDGKNLIRGLGDGKDKWGCTLAPGIIYQKLAPLPKPVSPGTYRLGGIQSYSYDDGTGPGAIPGHTGIHTVEVETFRVANGTSWKLGVRFFYDGKLLIEWIDKYTPLNQPPAWYVPGDDAHSWDLRLDHWVGGGDKARTVVNGKPIFKYDGLNQAGGTAYLSAVGTVPDAVLWQKDPKAAYYMDIFGIDVLQAV